MNPVQVWVESRGVTFDDDGNPEQSDLYAEVEVAYTELTSGDSGDAFLEWDAKIYPDWLEHPDGVRACRAAYELDTKG